MRGHVRKRGRTWSVVVDVGVDANGKRKQQWKGGFATKRDAERGLAELLQGLQSGAYVPPTNQTLLEFLENEWLPAVKATVRAVTHRSYEMHVRCHFGRHLGSVPLQKLTPAAINAFYADLAASGRSRGPGGLKPASIRRIHAVLHRALNDAVRWGRLARNPADYADPPPARSDGPHDLTTWSPAEVAEFLAGVAGDRLYAMWLLLVTTGLRRSEVAGLRWRDLDLDAGRVSVQRTRVAVGYDVVDSTPKTKRSRRAVAIDRATVDALRAHRAQQAQERLRCSPDWQDSGLVFVRGDGSPMHPDRISKLFDKLVADHGLRRVRLHDLRHTHATLALQAGIHPKVVSDRLGHSTTALTLDVYSHAVPGLQEEAAETVAGLFLPHRSSGDT